MTEESGVSIKVPLEVYQELVLRKIDTGVPISRQIKDLVIPKKKGKKNVK